MVLTQPELLSALQNETRILVHLAGKVDRATLDYRPTPKQRSTLELIQYLSMMGPALVQATNAGSFDADAWAAAEKAAAEHNLDQAVAAITAHGDAYASLLSGVSDADLRADINLFGQTETRGSTMVTMVLGSCAGYRMQLFLYLKASGRAELGSMNLWGGVDAPAEG